MAKITRRKIKKEMSAKTGPLVIESLFGRREIAPPTNFVGYVKEYEKSAWVYAAIFAIATNAAIVPWKIWEGRPGDSKELEPDSAPVQLLENPNDDMAWFDLLEATLTYLELAGDEYWEIARNSAGEGPPLKLFTIRPNRIKIHPTEDGRGVERYRFKVTPYAKNHQDFGPQDIVHFLYFNPTDDWYGLSPLGAAAQATLSERYTIDYNQNFFKNDATPAGLLHTDQPMVADQGEGIAAKWRKNMRGVNNAHRTPVLPFGLKYQAIGISPRDMQFLNQRRYNREEILGVFGVPPVKVGLLEFAKYDTYQLQEAAFYRDTIQPKLMKVAGKITKFLRREYGKTMTFEFDLTGFLTADKEAMATRDLMLFGAGAMTPNQMIIKYGIGETFEGGDQRYVSALYVPIDEEPMGAGEREGLGVMDQMNKVLEEVKRAVKSSTPDVRREPDELPDPSIRVERE